MLFAHRVAASWVGLNPGEQPFYVRYCESRNAYKADLTEKLQGLGDARVLEVGCDYGLLGSDLLAAAAKSTIVTVEWRPELLAPGHELIRARGWSRRWRIIGSGLQRMPFATASFDAAISIDSLHWWSSPHRVFAELMRVVKPGGPLYISDLRRDAEEELIRLVLLAWKQQSTEEANWCVSLFARSWVSAYTVPEVESLAREACLVQCDIVQDSPMTLSLMAVAGHASG